MFDHIGILFFLFSLAVFCLLYVFAKFSYNIGPNSLRMEWQILGFIPFGSREIGLDNIAEARRFELKKDLLSGAYIFGNLFIRRGVTLVLHRRMWLMKKIFVTPKDPDRFIEQIRGKCNAVVV